VPIRKWFVKDTKNPPGQLTLGNYLEEKYPELKKKKLTFDEWWHQNNDENTHYEWARHIWKAAQENK
jgi:hypothetical protein